MLSAARRWLKKTAEQPDGTKDEVMRYGRGEFIGERSLMTGQIRTADCVAEGDVQILKLMKEDFLVMNLEPSGGAGKVDSYAGDTFVARGAETAGEVQGRGGPRQNKRLSLLQTVHVTKVVMGSSEDLVCSW